MIALINLEDDTIIDLDTGTQIEASTRNAEAQAMDERLFWRPLTPFEIGLMIGQTLPVLAALAKDN